MKPNSWEINIKVNIKETEYEVVDTELMLLIIGSSGGGVHFLVKLG
jgi:hypothetical protein